MTTPIEIATVAVCALAVNSALTPLIIRIAHKRGIYDLPNGRKVHTDPIPRLAGIGIFLSFLIAVMVVPAVFALFIPGYRFPFSLSHLPVLLGFILTSAVGLADDFRSLRARFKFIVQLCAGILVTVGGYSITAIDMPGIGILELGIWKYPVTVLWIAGITNALNFIDGVDGLAGGISSFASLSMGVIFLIQGQPVSALIAFALLGSALSFLIFNVPPARIFMGDCGAYLFGFTLAVLPLLDLGNPVFLGEMSAAIVLLTIPILDTAYAIIRRVKQRRSPLSPDKEHIHHKLIDLGLKDWDILKIIGLASAVLSAAAIITGTVRGLLGTVSFFASWALSIFLYVLPSRLLRKR